MTGYQSKRAAARDKLDDDDIQDHTAQSFIDALNMKTFPELGYVLVKKDQGLFWESTWWGCKDVRYPANQQTRDNLKKVGHV